MTLTQDGLYCPGCGYDLRGLASGQCPECGMAIDQIHSNSMVWEDRRAVGYSRAFVRTLLAASLAPARLARSTGRPLDVRSALLFRRIVRIMICIPCVALFVYLLLVNGGIEKLRVVDGEGRVNDPLFEPSYLWQSGATWWPVLPIGFLIAIVLGTGIMHWMRPRHRPVVVQNRAMALSCYLIAPLAWIFAPCLGIWLLIFLPRMFDVPDFSRGWPVFAMILMTVASGVVIVMALLNALRGVSVAVQLGTFATLLRGVGMLTQFVACMLIGLWLFPICVGVWRFAIASLLH